MYVDYFINFSTIRIQIQEDLRVCKSLTTGSECNVAKTRDMYWLELIREITLLCTENQPPIT
jgi:hypothetical protein